MKFPPFLIVVLSLVISEIPAFAQTSPEILADGRVTFRCRAPGADGVKAVGQFGDEIALTRGEKDLWTGTTTGKVAPGVFEYHFSIDGIAHQYAISAGDDHSWPVWRRYLAEFAAKLFQ